MFYRQCENGEYDNFYLYIYFYIFYFYFFFFRKSKMCHQHFLRFLSIRVRSRIALLYFFFSSGLKINLYMRKSCYTVNSPLPNISLRRTTLVWCCLPPPPRHCPVIGCNYALYKTETSLRRIMDTFETGNGPLISALAGNCN